MNVVKLLPSQRKKLKNWLRGGKRGVLELRRMRILYGVNNRLDAQNLLISS